MPPYISVVVPTSRLGGIDILLDSLKAQSFTDFELVLVDALHEIRKDEVAAAAADRFVRLIHLPPQPATWPIAAFCAAANTGLAAATGDVVLHAVDFTRFPSEMLARHAHFHRNDRAQRGGLMSPHRYVKIAPTPGWESFVEDLKGDLDKWVRAVAPDVGPNWKACRDKFLVSIGKATDEPADEHVADAGARVPHDADPKLREPAGRIAPSFFHGKCESLRRVHALAAGGWDEDYDGSHLYQDTDYAERVTRVCGVEWHNDPSLAVEIANPRRYFPLLRRVRPPESNKRLFDLKRAAGFPHGDLVSSLELRRRQTPPVRVDVEVIMPGRIESMQVDVRIAGQKRIVMVYGAFSSAIHGGFDPEHLYDGARGLTGSESSFWNLARSLAEEGHAVCAFAKLVDSRIYDSLPEGMVVMPLDAVETAAQLQGVAAMIAWNEPDYLRHAPAGALRVCAQQLNDFGYCQPNWQEAVDLVVCPSDHHREFLTAKEGLPAAKGRTIPNSVALELFAGAPPPRALNRAVYTSSPDRGLHHVLGIWPYVRAAAPGAELHIFYSLPGWLERTRSVQGALGERARWIEMALDRLAGHGVVVRGSVNNAQMARELRSAAALVYPCDTVRYTEGFGCSVLDAAAAGCVPIVAATDALPHAHAGVGIFLDHVPVAVPGQISKQTQLWIDVVGSVLTRTTEIPAEWSRKMAAHAQGHERRAIAKRWLQLLG